MAFTFLTKVGSTTILSIVICERMLTPRHQKQYVVYSKGINLLHSTPSPTAHDKTALTPFESVYLEHVCSKTYLDEVSVSAWLYRKWCRQRRARWQVCYCIYNSLSFVAAESVSSWLIFIPRRPSLSPLKKAYKRVPQIYRPNLE